MIPAPAQVLYAEVQALRHGDYAAAWRLMAPGFRHRCSRAGWIRDQRAALGQYADPSKLTVTFPDVVIRGRRAVLSYAVVYLGAEPSVSYVRGDAFVKVGDTWYDAGDAQTPCEPA